MIRIELWGVLRDYNYIKKAQKMILRLVFIVLPLCAVFGGLGKGRDKGSLIRWEIRIQRFYSFSLLNALAL